MCGLGKGSVPIDYACLNHKPRFWGYHVKTTQVEYDKLHPETFICAHVKVPVSTFSIAASTAPFRSPQPTQEYQVC